MIPINPEENNAVLYKININKYKNKAIIESMKPIITEKYI